MIIEAHDFARICVRAASEMKAEELVVLDVREFVSYCDYFVLCTGSNARQVRAVSQRVLDIMSIAWVKFYACLEKQECRSSAIQGIVPPANLVAGPVQSVFWL